MLIEEKKTATFQVRMRPSVKAAGEKAAAADSRSLAALMEWLLIEHLQVKGLLENPARTKPDDKIQSAKVDNSTSEKKL